MDLRAAFLEGMSRAATFVAAPREKAVLSTDIKVDVWIGFSRKSTVPSFIAITADGTSAAPLIITTGHFIAARSRSASRNSIPSMSGICRSSSTGAGSRERKLSKNSSPAPKLRVS